MAPGETVHASAVAIDGRGILIRGESGSGKSSLVLGLIDRDPAATRLVADDRVALSLDGAHLVATAPGALAGKLEVRGIGIVDMAHLASCPVVLVVDIRPAADCVRMPAAGDLAVTLLGVAVPRLVLPAGAADGPARVRFALSHLVVGKPS
jgi:HPr kinase/phosphorylase